MHQTKGKIWCYLFVICIVLLLGACGKSEAVPLDEALLAEQEAAEKETVDSTGGIVVYVCGEVNAPGVYELPDGSRLYQAVEAAGGMNDTAAGTYLNQAETLTDGQSIYVPSAEEAAEWQNGAGGMPGAGNADSTKVNINTAAADELMTLSGIGEAKARSIIEYRETNGRFQQIEDIKNIPGIKDGVFEKIRDQITV